MEMQETQAAHVFLKDIGNWHLWLRKGQFATLGPHRMSSNTHAQEAALIGLSAL